MFDFMPVYCFLPDSKLSNALNTSFNLCKKLSLLSVQENMNSPSTQFVPSRRMGIYEPIHQIGMWGEIFKSNDNIPNTPASVIVEVDNKLENEVRISEMLFFAW